LEKGNLTFEDGSEYEGEIVDGKGKLTMKSGEVYEGDWRDGEPVILLEE
jgi:hypothetical protein